MGFLLYQLICRIDIHTLVCVTFSLQKVCMPCVDSSYSSVSFCALAVILTVYFVFICLNITLHLKYISCVHACKQLVYITMECYVLFFFLSSSYSLFVCLVYFILVNTLIIYHDLAVQNSF